MQEYPARKIRNVVVVGHGGAGKTSLVEALAYTAGATTRFGKVDEGNTISDYDEEEIRRRISINTSMVPLEWKAHKVNILDTPGYADFVGEIQGAVRVAEAAIVVVNAVSGVEVGTELVWQYLEERSLPRLVVANKMDRENVDSDAVLAALREHFGPQVMPFQVPGGAAERFSGVVDLVGASAGKPGEVPAELEETAQSLRQGLVEAAAETDDELIMKYLEGEELTPEEVARALRKAILEGKVIPLVYASALKNLGAASLLDYIVELLPGPAEIPAQATDPAAGGEIELGADGAGPLAALVFKTFADPFVGKVSYFRVYSGAMASDSRVFNVRSSEEERLGQLFYLRGKEQIPTSQVVAGDIGAVTKLQASITSDTLCDRSRPLVLAPVRFPPPVYSAAISPKSQVDMDRMSGGLARLVEEDPTLRVRREPDTGETILSGMGDSHIDIALRRLKQKFGVEIEASIPKVPYKETVTQMTSAQGRYKRQTGGRGQFGDVWLRLEPRERGAGFEFADKVFGGAVPRNFIPAVEKGLREAIKEGILAGFPTTDFRAVLYDGSYHAVDSSDMAFQIAASLGFKKAVAEASPVLLEPIMKVAITVPENFMGDILGDLNARRARVLGMEQERGKSVITAEAPLAEMQRYATDIRAMTQGRGVFTMEFVRYDEVPSYIAEGIIAQAKAQAEKR